VNISQPKLRSEKFDNTGKIKCTLVQALRLCTSSTAHRGNRGTTLLFLDHGTRRGEGSASRPGRSLPPGKTQYRLYRRLGGPQGRSGQVRKISPPPEFNPRTVQPITSRYTDYATRPTIIIVIIIISLIFRRLLQSKKSVLYEAHVCPSVHL